MRKHILLTGGSGFIGSHTYTALADGGYTVTILDNFENARRDVPDRLEQIAVPVIPLFLLLQLIAPARC
jgi:UDP-glucose 4-epimerase